MFFSLFNWFHIASDTSSSPVETGKIDKVEKSETQEKIHILSDTEYTSIMSELHRLSEIVSSFQNKTETTPVSPEDRKPAVHPVPDALHNELVNKLRQLRQNMGESHGFTLDEIKELNELHRSICIPN